MALDYFLSIRQDEAVGIGRGRSLEGIAPGSGKESICEHLCRRGRGGGRIGRSHGGQDDGGFNPGDGAGAQMLVKLYPCKDLGWFDRSVRYLKSHVLLNQRSSYPPEYLKTEPEYGKLYSPQYSREKTENPLLLIRYPGVREAKRLLTRASCRIPFLDAGGKDLVKTEDQKWTMARAKG